MEQDRKMPRPPETLDTEIHGDAGCIVCGRPSGGRATCGSPQCDLELRQG